MMAEVWNDLTRLEQRLLIKLFGCGSTRQEDPAVVDALRVRGLIDETNGISMAGLFILTLAMREQRAVLRSRGTAK